MDVMKNPAATGVSLAGFGDVVADGLTIPRESKAAPQSDQGELFTTATPLDDLRNRFYRQAQYTAELQAYACNHGLDLGALAARDVVIGICRVRWFPGERFDFAEEYSSEAVVMEVVEEDAETVVDLVAWPMWRPDKFGTALGRADAIGLDQVRNPSTFVHDQALMVRRTPLRWLQAGCIGCVILNPSTAHRWLAAAIGAIAAEDADHGRELGRLLHPFFPVSRILVPTPVEAPR